MTSFALVLLIAGGVVLLAVCLWMLLSSSAVPSADPIADPVQAQLWAQRAEDALADFGLGSERAVAGKWASSAAALVGILSTVAFIAGPTDLAKDVGGAPALIAAVLVLLAAAVAAIGTLFAALAEQGTPVQTSANGGLYRALLRTRANEARSQIQASRILIVIALCLLILATGVAWLTVLAPAKKPSVGQNVLIQTSAGAQCGTLTRSGQQVELTAGAGSPAPIPGDAKITLVDSCP